MNKLEMAHEYAMLHMMNTQYKDVDDLEMVQWAFDYADAMQAEAEKRLVGAKYKEEWQPDWSKAPDGFDYFVKQYDDLEYFLSIKPDLEVGCWVTEVDAHWSDTIQNCPAPWRDSLRKRP